jgi:hypothetical protein
MKLRGFRRLRIMPGATLSKPAVIDTSVAAAGSAGARAGREGSRAGMPVPGICVCRPRAAQDGGMLRPAATPAIRDERQLLLVVVSGPQPPRRTAAILADGRSPLRAWNRPAGR